MAGTVWITAAAEGIVDEAAIRRLATDLAIPVAAVHLPTPGGKHQLDRRLPKYNAAAVHAPWLVLRDLDTVPAGTGPTEVQVTRGYP